MPILNGPQHGVRRWSIAAVVTVAAVLGAASTASAHELINGQASCTGLTTRYAGFADRQKPITYSVTVDTVALSRGTFAFPGPSGTLTVPFAAPLAAGNHVVTFASTWPGQAGQNGAFTQTVEGCPGPPAPPLAAPTPPSPPAASAPPAPVVAPARAAPVSRVKSAHVRRSAAKPVKKCRFGRRHLRDSHGRRFTMCRTKPVPIPVRSPHFAG